LEQDAPTKVSRARILLVDDDARVRESLPLVFSRWAGVEVAAVLPSADGLIYHIIKHRPDIVLLDLDMPGRSPFDTLAELEYRGDPARVVMFSGIGDGPSVRACLNAGACGYILKDDGLEAIADAIRTVMRGERYISPTLLSHGLVPPIELERQCPRRAMAPPGFEPGTKRL
jgi:two-component system, NarL family, response regulator DesR